MSEYSNIPSKSVRKKLAESVGVIFGIIFYGGIGLLISSPLLFANSTPDKPSDEIPIQSTTATESQKESIPLTPANILHRVNEHRANVGAKALEEDSTLDHTAQLNTANVNDLSNPNFQNIATNCGKSWFYGGTATDANEWVDQYINSGDSKKRDPLLDGSMTWAGVGIDGSNVVLHMCAPRPVQQFYQVPEENGGGAICNDGWRSYSVGRGTCSHHGGVNYYL